MKKLILFLITLIPVLALAQESSVIQELDSKTEQYTKIAMQIWENPELGYLESESSALHQQTLSEAGFEVKAGVAGIPTAFVAEFGSGKPVIGIMAEFDALPGVSQKASPFREAVVEGGAGHACGHHLFGTASVAAGVAVKNWLDANGGQGTIRVYGTPAEEGG
ncbi:M20/M25/M40 family metallo-hydrolase, partial [uncultured Algoriphagus sp.]